MTYVLIIAAWIGGQVSGPIITVQEFNSQAACEDAKGQLSTVLFAGERPKARAMCVKK